LFWQFVIPATPLGSKAKAKQSQQDNTIILKEFRYIKPVVKYGMPKRLVIPSLNFDRDILKGEYDAAKNTWNVSGTGVHFAYPTSQPNDYSGNTLIYGHNNKNVFGPLKKIKSGDIVEVITSNNLKFTYTYDKYEELEPGNVSIFFYEGDPVLTLQTCSGYWNEIRRLYTFKYVKVEQV
jgi:LPXTG-site transpeptidase (sortase) family protein